MDWTADRILTLVIEALATVNATKLPTERFAPAADTPLVGPDAVLTSLELVTFILEVETRLAEDLGLQLTLTDDRAFAQARSPFRRPRALAEYIVANVKAPAAEMA